MIINFSGKVETSEAEEEQVFKVMKQFLTEQFQKYEFAVSGKKETLRHKQEKREVEETKPKDTFEEMMRKRMGLSHKIVKKPIKQDKL